ncbi:Uncharacterised protein [Bordetella pertussis]|nr:Uncharacterised protein [Bordetella pertussis]CFP56971.1 Uncharacterised protein [Bordetella pertussis]CFW31114.1 Uncharacterised protein [Bordetella pertussis]CPM22437.1 Uncharacterised protein [Bordetella pertussis]
MAMMGRGQPMARRVPSSRPTIRMVPMATSIGSGLPTRNARSSKMYGMYRTLSASTMAMAQSYSGTPPGHSSVDFGSRW